MDDFNSSSFLAGDEEYGLNLCDMCEREGVSIVNAVVDFLFKYNVTVVTITTSILNNIIKRVGYMTTCIKERSKLAVSNWEKMTALLGEIRSLFMGYSED